LRIKHHFKVAVVTHNVPGNLFCLLVIYRLKIYSTMRKFLAGWVVIYTKPRHEKKVYTKLTEAGITAFLPTTKSLRIWSDRQKYTDMPLFPSYIFVYLNDLDDHHRAKLVDGFLRYITFGNELARINKSVISNIQLMVDSQQQLEISDEIFQPGDKICVSDGVLTGLSGEIIERNGERKILVRVNLLKRNILLEMPVTSVSGAD
jgi:transcriptional antiterminator RfaH